ncbi:MAG TPA: hypothetical protein VGJ12_12015, partial [Gemmatimonadaceae bacterium]
PEYSGNDKSTIRVIGHIGDETPWLLPALSVLSESCAARVDKVMLDHWARRSASILMEYHIRVSVEAGLLPDPKQIGPLHTDVPRQRELIEEFKRAWPLLPSPSDEMRRASLEFVEREQQEWLDLAAESKRRLDARKSPTGSPPATPPHP